MMLTKGERLFEHMQQEGMKPDSVTLVSVLSACSHSGIVDEGPNVVLS